MLTGPLLPSAAAAPSGAAAPSSAYRANDYADGQAMSINPPGENGLVNAVDLAKFELTKQRPANSDDQLQKYNALLYASNTVTDSTLGKYYNDESFGVRPADITKTEKPTPGLTIYRDRADVPHVFADGDATLAFGAGYAQAEDRLFLMDVLRHYGAGRTSEFLGPSCADEQMDHDQLLLAPYTEAQAQQQIDSLPAKYGPAGVRAKTLITNYVKGVNAYIAKATTNPTLLPADYAATVPNIGDGTVALPKAWKPSDVVYVAGLIGGIFGKGGGIEVANAALRTYVERHLGKGAGDNAFAQFKEQNDPGAPTTIVDKSVAYETPGTVDAATTAIPDSSTLRGGPTDTTPNCDLTAVNPAGLATIASLQNLPKSFSNALVLNAGLSKTGHPTAVFGPQVAYFAPEILSQLDLHSPGYSAEGASFPGTGLVELGRGADYAWSATSAGTDIVDQRLEKICDPHGGTPAAQGKYYDFDGQCLPMTHETFSETGIPKLGGQGAPVMIKHVIYKSRHGIIQGWTTSHGQPVAVVNQRSTYNHDIDSVIGFIGFGSPAQTHDVTSWTASAAKIAYTFNWFYVDDRDTGYFVSGLDPVRPRNVDPNLPTWGTGNAEWQGYLPANAHPQEVNPPQGFFVSWNNKPAPGFSAADDQYGYGPTYRSQMLVAQIKAQLAQHGGKLTRAQLVRAMETAATQDLDGLTALPQLLAYERGRAHSGGVRAMLQQLAGWVTAGANRKKAAAGDTQYAHASGVAIADELVPNLIHAIYDSLLAAGGSGSQGSTGGATADSYAIVPMQFVNTPNSGGARLGSAYDGGWEGYLQKTLQQLRGQSPPQPFTSGISDTWCGSGPSSCVTALESALTKTYDALRSANGSSNVAGWTQSTATAAEKTTMPLYDQIAFTSVGIVGQPNADWQNRPTFQQVVSFPRHRDRASATTKPAGATVGPGSAAPVTPNTNIPTGVPAGYAKPAVPPDLPLGLLAVGLLIASGGAAAWKLRGRHSA